jgi:hypothetical protein
VHLLGGNDARIVGRDGIAAALLASGAGGFKTGAGALLNQPALKLRQGGEDVKDQLARGGRRIKGYRADSTKNTRCFSGARFPLWL